MRVIYLRYEEVMKCFQATPIRLIHGWFSVSDFSCLSTFLPVSMLIIGLH
jgi:hypothetical protein